MTKLSDAASLAEVGAWFTEYSVYGKSKESQMSYEAESRH